MRVFLDTNIVLDFFSGRQGDGVAERLVQIGRSPEYELCISPLTAANTMYVAMRHYKSLLPQDLMKFFTILPMDALQWRDACDMKSDDFEDALQMACANDAACNVIVTRNAVHYSGSVIPVYSPADFVGKIEVVICSNDIRSGIPETVQSIR